ncbi:MAG: serine/threonine protein kinase [Deltaproteobacteria bacterium]|nr:serine/threonine protein kinase [Deltaproteobacteria bacterium]
MSEPTDQLPRSFGKYTLLELIGTGGMAEIYKARAVGPDGFEKILVIKKILPELATNKAFVNLLVAEAKVTSLLNHPNIVQIHELGEVAHQYYIAMELVDGADLLNILSACTRHRLRLPIEVALHIVSEVCRGLAHAHAATDATGRALNVIHRDVSPSNVLISKHGDIKIMDFGVARADLGLPGAPDTHEMRGTLKGKLGYMSPEQVLGKPIDRRSDIFALGVMLFECLTLKRLFVGATDVQTLLNIREADVEQRFKRHSYLPKPVRAILRRALAKEPVDRFQTATDFQEAILDYLFDSRLKVSSRNIAQFLDQVLAPDREVRREKTPPPSVVVLDTSQTVEDEAVPVPPPLPPPAPPSVALARPRALRRFDLSKGTFHFKHDDESVYGPVDFERLVSLLGERAVGPREWISINGSDWMRVADVRAVVDLQPSLIEEEPSRPLDDGPVNRYRTPGLLLRIARERLTGKLKLQAGTLQKEIFFDQGEPRFAFSNLKRDLFGTFLIESGLADPAQIEQALERVVPPFHHLGTALVELGILSADRVRSALGEHLRARILEVATWRTGWYEFYEGVLSPREGAVSLTPLPRLVMEAIRAHYRAPDLRGLFAELVDHVLILARDPAPFADILGLQPEELRARPLLRTNATLRALIAQAPGEAAQLALLRVAFALHQSDVLAFRAPPSFARAP